MKIRNKKSGNIYKVTGSYYSAINSEATLYICPEGDTDDLPIPLARFMTEYELADKNTSGADATEFGVIATSKLANVEIASKDYQEGGKKYFTFDEACAIEKKVGDGWRLPTRSEWALICEEFGQKEGRLDAETLINNLNLKRGGYLDSGNLYSAGLNGWYWSSTPYSNASQAYLLYFTSSVNPSTSNARFLGFSVRLVRDCCVDTIADYINDNYEEK